MTERLYPTERVRFVECFGLITVSATYTAKNQGAMCGIGGGIALPETGVPVGNMPTEDLVAMMSGMGIVTGLDLAQVVAASRDVARMLDIVPHAPTLFPEMRRRGARDGELISLLAAARAMSETIPPLDRADHHRFRNLRVHRCAVHGWASAGAGTRRVARRGGASRPMFAARQYRFFAGYADKLWGKTIPLDQRDTLDYTTREPIGVAVLITAWNSPMGLLSNKLAPALAAGNCVVVKLSEHASATTLEFAKLIEAAGFPPGVFNVVTGDARVGRALLAGGRIDWVSVTGSPAIRREIAAAAGRALVPVTLELGGKSPNIVFENADLKKAIIGALAGIFAATGQTCIAGSRLDEVPHRAQRREALYGRHPGGIGGADGRAG